MKCCQKKTPQDSSDVFNSDLQLSKNAWNKIKQDKNSTTTYNTTNKSQVQLNFSQLKQSIPQTAENTKNIKTKGLRPIKSSKQNNKKGNKQQSAQTLNPNSLPSLQPSDRKPDQQTKKKALNPIQMAQLNDKYKRPSSQTCNYNTQNNELVLKQFNEWNGKNTEAEWRVGYPNALNRGTRMELINFKHIDQGVLEQNNLRNSIKRDLKERFGTVYDQDEVLVQTLVDKKLEGKQYKPKDITTLYNMANSYDQVNDDDDITYEALQSNKSKFKTQQSNNKLQNSIQSMYNTITGSHSAQPNQAFMNESHSSYYERQGVDKFNQMKEQERQQLLQEFSKDDNKVKSEQAKQLEYKLQQELYKSKVQSDLHLSQ